MANLTLRPILVLSFFGLLGVTAAMAQQQETARTQVDSTPPLEVIPLHEVSRRAASDQLRIVEMAESLAQLALTEEDGEALATVDSTLAVLSVISAPDSLTQMSAGRLQPLAQRWARQAGRLRSLMDRLDDKARQVLEHRDTVVAVRRVWRNTLDSAQSVTAPPAIVERITNTLSSLDSLREATGTLLDSLLAKTDETSTLLVLSQREQARVEQRAEQAQLQIISPDSRPIWSMLKDQVRDRPLAGQLAEHLPEWSRERAEFFEAAEADLPLHLFLVALLGGTMWYFYRHSRAWIEDDTGVSEAQSVLSHPVWLTLFVGVGIGWLVYPTYPLHVRDLVWLVWLPLAGRIAAGRAAPQLLGPMLVTLLFLPLLLFSEVFDVYSMAWRTYLLVVLSLLTLLLGFSAWRSRSYQPQGRVERLGLWYLRGGAALAAIGMIGSILGFGALAEWLIRVLLVIPWVVILFLATVVTLRSLWIGLLRTPVLLQSNAVKNNVRLLDTRGNRAITIVVALGGVTLTLWALNLLGRLWAEADAIMDAGVSYGQISISIGGILLFVLTIYGAMLLSRFIRFILAEDLLPRVALPRGVPQAISIMLNYIILGLGFFLAVSAVGIDFSNLAILAGAFGLGIGFGLQNVINNFVSGLILLFERPIQIDDVVEVGTLVGTVRRIGIRSSTIRSYSGAEVIVPNANLVSNDMINWTLSDRRRRLEVPVGVAYGTDPEVVLELLARTAAGNELVADDPPPWAVFKGFGDSSLNFVLYAWVNRYDDGLSVMSQLAVAINGALKDAGIEIPFPQRDLHLRSIDSSVGERLAGRGSAEQADSSFTVGPGPGTDQ